MKTRICQHPTCFRTIPSTRRADAKYCCDKCSYTTRNARTKVRNAPFKEEQAALKRYFSIIDGLFKRGYREVSQEILEVLGYDASVATKFGNFNKKENTITLVLFSYKLTFFENKALIEKIK